MIIAKTNKNRPVSIKALVASLLIFSFLLSCPFCVFASALPGEVMPPSSGGITVDVVGLGDYLCKVTEGISQGAVNKFEYFVSGFNDDVCTAGSSANGRHNFVLQHTQVDGKVGDYYICEYCGLSAGEVFDKTYAATVSELPATGIDSEGYYIITPNYVAVSANVRGPAYGDSYERIGTEHGGTSNYPLSESFQYVSSIGNESSKGATLVITPLSGVSSFMFASGNKNSVSLVAIIGYNLSEPGMVFPDGVMRLRYSGFINDGSESSDDITCTWSSFHSTGGSHYSWWTQGFNFALFWHRLVISASNDFVIRFLPDSGAIDLANDTTYNVGTRTGSIIGDYGIMGDDGSISVIENQSIVNEGDHSYYNAVTGETYDMPTYNYDYSTRTYNITYTDPEAPEGEQEKQATVTYGDENITITDSGNTYNIYYVIERPAADDGHTHDYSGSVTRQPSCTTTGVKTYSCSICNDTYTETLPALGHDWQIKKQVQTEYNDAGELVTQGYTVFRCSRCGEEYRSDDSVNPSPPDTGGSSGGGSGAWTDFITWLKDLFGSVADAFKGIVEYIIDIFSKIPELFSGYLDFLGKLFPYLPEETTMLLSFGFAALVAIGIIRILRR